ncbi:aromatic alcohol reductase [Arthrobacter ruber]|uniref:aromatic alcohol reductase n=1 Tax=Arthrobacter ruber TaxID=1258893 RepID=UPI000CF390ED|nr:aromatic alcohol reductase [Arthrobacter ruber]
MPQTIALAGATGDLGERIARALLDQGAEVRVLTRASSNPEARGLRSLGADVLPVDYSDADGLKRAVGGADAVVSALSGLAPVILDTQTRLLMAAVAAGVPRFVPSDFSLDHTTIRDGSNRNLQLRRDFRAILDAAPLRATSVLNGAFADMLTGVAPLILFGRRRVLYWGDADQPMAFTTKDDVAAYTAHAALDRDAPRFLRIAGDTVSSRDLAGIMTSLDGEPYRLLYAGGIGPLRLMARTGQALSRDSEDLYPAWQGMQYFGNMFSGDGAFHALDNDRYGVCAWTSAREILEGHRRAEPRTAAA